MADEETIVIRVNAAQGEAALKALGAAGIKAGKDLETIGDGGGKQADSLTDKYAKLGAKLFGITKIIGAAGEAFKEVAIATGNYTGATKDAIDEVSNLTQSIASFDLAGASRAMGQLAGQTVAWAQGLQEANVQLGNAVDLKAVDAFKKLLAVQKELVDTHVADVDALNLRSAALVREIELQSKSGNVSEFLKEKLKEILDAYGKVDEFAPSALQRQASSLGVVSTEAEKSAEKVKDLADAHEKLLDKVLAGIDGDSAARKESTALLLEAIARTEEHGVVTQQSAEKIQAAVTAEIELYKSFGDAVPAALQAVADQYAVIDVQQQKVIANAQQIIKDIDAAAIKANQAQNAAGDPAVQANAASAAQLQQQIDKIEKSPIITTEQQNNLDALKNSLLDNRRAAQDLNRVFTVTTDEFKTEAEAADKLAAELSIATEAQRFLASAHDRAIASTEYNDRAAAGLIDTYHSLNDLIGDTGETFTDMGGEVENLAGYLDDAGDAIEDLGDKGKDGTDKAAENLAKMNEGLKESIPLATTLKGLLQEIVALGAAADI